MIALLSAFAVPLDITLWAVHAARSHHHLFMDHDVSGPQKFHHRPVPRVGGIGIFGDPVVGALALAGIGAVLGFLVWNFPGGLIFLGDVGANFLGFYVAEALLLLLVRNPQVSPLFPLLVCTHPVTETLFSVYRRRVLRSLPPSMPDGIHLRSLIYRRVMRWAVGDKDAKALTRRNSMTSPFLRVLCMLSVMSAVLFWGSSALMALFLLLFALAYVTLYWRIVRFRSPRWMRLLTPRPLPDPPPLEPHR
jgi:UDP-N-acetylmuramyl pentapeptide phosphotransferase/UDP-N-acetylglucosamine-1-phosphate transferase